MYVLLAYFVTNANDLLIDLFLVLTFKHKLVNFKSLFSLKMYV